MEQFGGPFLIIDTYAGMGCACLLTALWVILTCDDYYKDKEGNKVKVDIRNEFFFIKMKYWSYIFVVLGLVLIGNIVFHYFPLA
ncbi:hypothetical protein CLV51_10662 [Chitinophaga niastensis]|uniref:Uncharacterized protein n=1 Tax=Chitinophaga niastensis TaxID=536980 RepID=A0A2P8HDA0_CHINA|nr:hypothetical protein [Chitinophaga niastensis]PSL44197.1 hypothetical protein CLV51_10662 [Chitinophaga niastensis]